MHMLVANLLSGAFSDAYSDAKFNAFESQPMVLAPPSPCVARVLKLLQGLSALDSGDV